MPARAPAISVVVPHYGDPATTLQLVRQLLEQTLPVDVVVVDDCSPTPFPNFDRVTVVRRTSNGGFGSAVNSGAAATEHDLLIMNSDVSIGPDFVERLVRASEPWQPALVGPAVETGGVTEHTARRFPRPRYQAFERLRLLARFRDSDWRGRLIGLDLRARPGEDRPVDWVAGVCLFVPRTAFDLVGGFDERFFMYAEEVDLQRRLAAAGIPRVYLGSVALGHLGGASSDPVRAQEWLADSRLTYAAKWGGILPLRAMLSGVALVNAATDGARRLVGRDVRPLHDLRVELREAWRPPHRAR